MFKVKIYVEKPEGMPRWRYYSILYYAYAFAWKMEILSVYLFLRKRIVSVHYFIQTLLMPLIILRALGGIFFRTFLRYLQGYSFAGAFVLEAEALERKEKEKLRQKEKELEELRQSVPECYQKLMKETKGENHV